MYIGSAIRWQTSFKVHCRKSKKDDCLLYIQSSFLLQENPFFYKNGTVVRSQGIISVLSYPHI